MKTGLDILVEDGKIADIKPREYKRKGKWLMLRVVILLPVLLIYIYMVPMVCDDAALNPWKTFHIFWPAMNHVLAGHHHDNEQK